MWVARKGFAAWGPAWQAIGRALAVLFCITLVVATITGISFFQMWNVANITESYFGIPGVWSSIVMAMLVALVVIGGIRRLGAVAGWLVPFMILLYIGGGLVLLLLKVDQLPAEKTDDLPGFISYRAFGRAHARAGARGNRRRARAFHRHAHRLHVFRARDPGQRCVEPCAGCANPE